MIETKQPQEQQGETRLPPSWLTKEVIHEALRNSGESNSQIETIDVSLPIPAGGNYGSTIYRAKATLTDGQERSFIVKGPAPRHAWSSALCEARTNEREATMLTEVIPQMQELLEEAAPGQFPPLAPRCYHHSFSPVEFLVLEDLGPAGFQLADRKKGLGLRHSLIAFRTLARFHAASYALLKRHPELAEKLGNAWRVFYKGMEVFVQCEIQAAVEATRSWPGFEDCADRLEKFKDVAMDTFTELNDAKPGAFNVIVHGDYWVNNMMFSYEDQEVKGHRAFDLQVSHVASPAVDLVYLLGSSLSDNVHEHHQGLLLREYHRDLSETLKLFGLQGPSLESLLSAVDAHGPFSLFVALSRPILKAKNGLDLPAIFSGDHSCLVPVYEFSVVKPWMQRVLRDYVSKGWLPA